MLHNPALRDLCIMVALFNFVSSTMNAELVYFAKQRLGATDSEWAFFAAASGVGVIALALLAGPLRKRLSFSQVALGALFIFSLLNIALAFTTMYWAALVLWSLMGGLGVLFNINVVSLFQAMTPPNLMGRIMSVATTLVWSAIPLGSFIGGWLIDTTGNLVLVFAGIGVVSALIPIAFAFTSMGHAEDYLPDAARSSNSANAVPLPEDQEAAIS